VLYIYHPELSLPFHAVLKQWCRFDLIGQPCPMTTARGKTAEWKIAVICTPSGVGKSPLWRRNQVRQYRRDKAAIQQYLTLHEEIALVDYILHVFKHRYPLSIKFLRSPSTRNRTSSAFWISAFDNHIWLSGKK